MQQEEFEQETLLKQQATKLTEDRSRDPLPLRRPRRPYKGIFLAFFLWFTGMMFFVHGFHKYEDYSWFDLISVWFLSILRTLLFNSSNDPRKLLCSHNICSVGRDFRVFIQKLSVIVLLNDFYDR